LGVLSGYPLQVLSPAHHFSTCGQELPPVALPQQKN
jgi:hypothetical protein